MLWVELRSKGHTCTLRKLHATVPTPLDTCCNCALVLLLVCSIKPPGCQLWSQKVVCSARIPWAQADRLLLQVAPFFFQLEDEAGGLKHTPSGCAVKLGNKAAGVHISESGLPTEVVPPSDLKAPASIEDEAKVPNSVMQTAHIYTYTAMQGIVVHITVLWTTWQYLATTKQLWMRSCKA